MSVHFTGKTGVYQIRNTVNGKVYVGSAAQTFAIRWQKHRNELRKNIHHSYHLQAAWNKYGEAAFAFEILVLCKPEDCERLEQVAIDEFDSADEHKGYNIAPSVSRGPLGVKRRPETKAKLSAALRGKPKSPEHRANLAAANRGKKQSAESRAKMSASRRGRKLSASHCASMSAGNRTPAASAKHSASAIAFHTGRKRSAETRAKMSAAQIRIAQAKNKNVYVELFD